MDNYELPKIAVRKLNPGSAKKLQAEAKEKFADKGRENVVGASVEEQEKEKETEAEVESFRLDFGEFPLNASLLENGPYARRVASKLIFPADAERFGNTSDALLADHLMTASIVTNQISCEAARRFLAVETRAKKYEEETRLLTGKVFELQSKLEEETRLLTREVLELESKLINATTLCELTKEELDLLRAKTSFLEDSARKNSGNNLQLKEYRIQELELELKSMREAAEKEKEEAINAAYQHFVKDLAQRDEFLAAKYYTKGRNSAKLQIKERADVEMSKVELDSDYDDYQSDVNDCPVRERQSCERLVEIIENDSSRELRIRKGRGTALKDIPNVSYKMSRVKNYKNFKQLHVVLYGRRGQANQVKHNVSQFSGFVWQGDEENERLNIKEKLGRFVKVKLLQFCDLLDISIVGAYTVRKGDISLKLINFLEAPHATTDILLAEKDQGSKGCKRKKPDQSEDERHSSGGENDSESEEGSKMKTVGKKIKTEVKIVKEEPSTLSKSSPDHTSENNISKRKDFSIIKLRERICEILKEADLNTVSVYNVIKQLGENFRTGLTFKSLKLIIKEEYSKLDGNAEEEEEEEEEEDDDEEEEEQEEEDDEEEEEEEDEEEE